MVSELNRSITGPTSGSSTAFSAFNRSYGTALGVITATLVSCFIFIIFDRTSSETMAITQGPAPYFPSTQDTCDRCDLVVFLVYFVKFYCLDVSFIVFLLPFPSLSSSTPFLSFPIRFVSPLKFIFLLFFSLSPFRFISLVKRLV
jgi:hypothetical protein